MEIAIGILVLLLIILWHPIMTNLEKLTDWLAEKKKRKNLRVLLDKNEFEDRMQDKVKGLKEYQKKRQVCREQTVGTDHDSDFLQVLTSSDENIKQERLNQERDNMESNLRTKSYFLLILKKIGCAYEINEEDSILFTWQGGHFMADATEDCPFVVIWYMGWEYIELSDVNALSRARKVINLANINYNLNVVYSIDENAGTFILHTKKHFYFTPPLKDSDLYLKSTLEQFFVVRRYVESELDKLKNQEELKYNGR